VWDAGTRAGDVVVHARDSEGIDARVLSRMLGGKRLALLRDVPCDMLRGKGHVARAEFLAAEIDLLTIVVSGPVPRTALAFVASARPRLPARPHGAR
jgi:hypothetical protein